MTNHPNRSKTNATFVAYQDDHRVGPTRRHAIKALGRASDPVRIFEIEEQTYRAICAGVAKYGAIDSQYNHPPLGVRSWIEASDRPRQYSRGTGNTTIYRPVYRYLKLVATNTLGGLHYVSGESTVEPRTLIGEPGALGLPSISGGATADIPADWQQ